MVKLFTETQFDIETVYTREPEFPIAEIEKRKEVLARNGNKDNATRTQHAVHFRKYQDLAVNVFEHTDKSDLVEIIILEMVFVL